MWTDKALESLIPIATALLGSDRKATKYLTIGSCCIDQEVDIQEWRSWTPGLRAYYVVFWYAIFRGDASAIYSLAPKQQAAELYARITQERHARFRELTREADWTRALSRMVDAHTKQEERQTRTPRQTGWTREDVVAEYYSETGEPMLGPPRKKAEPIMPEYDKSPSPVRKISPEEYQATKRKPVYGGVKPEFAKESEHFAKELPDNADKIYDGTPLDELIGQTT